MDLKVRHRLPAALCWSMAGITFFFISFGAAGYLAYGRDVANFVTMVGVCVFRPICSWHQSTASGMECEVGAPAAGVIQKEGHTSFFFSLPLTLFGACLFFAFRLFIVCAANAKKNFVTD